MRRNFAIAALKAANPVPSGAKPAAPRADAQSPLVRVGAGQAGSAEGAWPAAPFEPEGRAVRPPLRRWPRAAWVVGATATAAAAGVAIVVAAANLGGAPAGPPVGQSVNPVTSASPADGPDESADPVVPPADGPIAPAPPVRVLSGEVLSATSGVAGTAWSASALARLADEDGDGSFHFVRAWSMTRLKVGAAGDPVAYSESSTGEPAGDHGMVVAEGAAGPLEALPGYLFYPEDSYILTPSLMWSRSVPGADGAVDCLESGMAIVPEESPIHIYLPAEIDGVRVGVVINQRDGDLIFYAAAHGGDPARARAMLEGLAITPQGGWADPTASLGLTPPADLADQLSQASATLEDGSTINACPLGDAADR
ncbi:MAG: hypothetical protein LBC97_11900 [Bifidobacteriaceae bacterium]|jgi:hypothetical protein|nr:hypothetical protein [Bifidobacteriaceae bacterium]